MNMNLNRLWPDTRPSPPRTYVREITTAVWNTYLKHADLCIDLHCWSGTFLPLACAFKRDRKLLRAFGMPWHMLLDKNRKWHSMTGYAAVAAHGIPTIHYELVPQNIVDIEAVCMGERSILNGLKFMGMLTGELDIPEYQYEFDERNLAVRTTEEGLLVSDYTKGQMVRKGQTLVRVLSLETLATVWEFKAPHDAMAFCIGANRWGEDMTENFVVYPGQTVAILRKPLRIIHNR